MKLVAFVAKILHVSPLVAPWLVALLFPLLYELSRLVSNSPRSRTEVVLLYGAPVAMALGTTLLTDAFRASREALVAFSSILSDKAQYFVLYGDIEDTFSSSRQNRFAWLAGSAFFGYYVVMWPNLTSWALHTLVAIEAVWGAIISGFGVSLVLATMGWIRRLPKYGELKLFILPARTVELRELSRLTGLFALYFSIQVLAEALVVYSTTWTRPVAVDAFSATIVTPIVLLSVAFFFYPQLAIRRVIRDRKARELRVLSAAPEKLQPGDTRARAEIAQLYRDIDDSSDFALDAATILRFASSAVVALVGVGLERFVAAWLATYK